MLRIFMTLAVFFIISPAFAHLGHVGELAGHSHWIGIGAVVVAGVLAGAIGKLTEKDKEETSEEEQDLGEDATVEG